MFHYVQSFNLIFVGVFLLHDLRHSIVGRICLSKAFQLQTTAPPWVPSTFLCSFHSSTFVHNFLISVIESVTKCFSSFYQDEICEANIRKPHVTSCWQSSTRKLYSQTTDLTYMVFCNIVLLYKLSELNYLTFLFISLLSWVRTNSPTSARHRDGL